MWAAILLPVLMTGEIAAGQVNRASLGLMVDAHQQLRPVRGVAASSTLGEALVPDVLSAGCAGMLCLAKTDGQLWSVTSSSVATNTAVTKTAAPAGGALFAFSGAGAYVFFPTAGTLHWWHEGQLDALPNAPLGEVLSMIAIGDGIDYAVRRGGAIWREHLPAATASVKIVSLMETAASAITAVMLSGSGTLIAEPTRIRFLPNSGGEAVIPISGVQTFLLMTDGYAQAVAGSASWVIRLDSATGEAYLLPGAESFSPSFPFDQPSTPVVRPGRLGLPSGPQRGGFTQ